MTTGVPHRSRIIRQASSPDMPGSAISMMTTAGESSGIVESPTGLYLLKFTGEQPEVNRTFDQVKAQIAMKLSRERKTKEFDEWLKALKEKAKVTVDEKALEAVEVAAVSPGAQMGGPMMGGPMMGGPGPGPMGGMRMAPPAPGPAPVAPATMPAAPAR